jgi:hypothetical protein
VLPKWKLEARLVRQPRANGESPDATTPEIQIDPEQIAQHVQETIIYGAVAIGSIVLAKKVLDIVGDVTVAIIQAKAK